MTGKRLELGEVFGAAGRLLAEEAPTFLLIALVCTLPSALLDWALLAWRRATLTAIDLGMVWDAGYDSYDPNGAYEDSYGADLYGTEVLRISTLMLGASSLGRAFTIAMAQAMMLYPVVERLAGRRTPAFTAVAKGVVRIPATLGVMTLVSAAVLFSSTCFVLPAVILAALFFFAVPAAVVETLSPFRAIGRSVELTRGYRPVLLGGVGILLLVFAVAGMLVRTSLGAEPLLWLEAGDLHESTPFLPFAAEVALGVAEALTIALVSSVMYAQLRERDGIDVEELARVFA